MPFKNPMQIFTYETRLEHNEHSSMVLDALAQLFSQIERSLFSDLMAGKSHVELKSDYLNRFQITARHFNSIYSQLEGKIASIKEKRIVDINNLQEKIKGLEKTIKSLKNPHTKKCHQKKRRLANLKTKLKQLQRDREEGKIRICFGTKHLFKEQFNLEANGYANHAEWFKKWQDARNNSFFLLGSKDEANGNQSCTATIASDGSLTLRIRLPDALKSLHNNDKYLLITGLRFKYGHAEIIAGVHAFEERKKLQKANDISYKDHGVPISFRFKRDQKSWRVFVSLPKVKPLQVTSQDKGVIGIDLNANHLAICETDRFGNPIKKQSISIHTYGKTRAQANALIGDACARIVTDAKKQNKPLAFENLDFSKKKATLRESSPKYARMLSSLSYNKIKQCLKIRAWKEGVQIFEINPAFTSIIGRVKFAKRYGLTIHQAAALVIARRSMKASEKIPRHLDSIPDGKGNHVTLSVPVRNRDKHVWSQWGVINKKLKATLAACARTNHRSSSANTAPEI